jgi:very-short-patch-repair endonuclease
VRGGHEQRLVFIGEETIMRGSRPWTTNRARVLRSGSSSACNKMWSELRNRQFGGYKFIREHPIGPFFVDFCCRAEKVVVEIDGGTHGTADETARDRARETFLRAQGYRIFRVHNSDVYENLDGVRDTLLAFLRGEVD